MKFALAYYLLLLYAMVILKPLIPVVEDSIEHCFAEAYHIATVHAKYGSNHLEKEIANTNDSNDNSNNKNILNDDASSVHIVLIVERQHEKDFKPKISYNLQPVLFIKKILLTKICPPPKFLF